MTKISFSIDTTTEDKNEMLALSTLMNTLVGNPTVVVQTAATVKQVSDAVVKEIPVVKETKTEEVKSEISTEEPEETPEEKKKRLRRERDAAARAKKEADAAKTAENEEPASEENATDDEGDFDGGDESFEEVSEEELKTIKVETKKLLGLKADDHRATIKAKFTELGAGGLGTLADDKYPSMLAFLKGLK